MSYRIKTVASLTGISATTLRAWERRYDVVEPRRTDSGYRVYDEGDVARLAHIKTLIDKGFKPGEAIDLIRRGISAPPEAELPPEALSRISAELLDALLKLDRDAARESYRKLSALPIDRQVDEVLLPLLGEVGELWQGGECSIAQEHFSSAFVRERLIGMLDLLGGGVADGPEAVCAGLPGELHEFGLMAAAIHLALRGWRVTYLGADVPVDEIGVLLRQRRPALLCSSLVCARSHADCLTLAAAFRAASPAETAVVIGGAGLPEGLPRRASEGLYLLREISELFDLAQVSGN